MEKTDVAVEQEEQVPVESKKVIDQVTDDVSKKIEEPNGDNTPPIDHKNDDEVVPSTTPKPTEEQENVTETNINVSASVSPGRANVPFKEVNESDKEENTPLVNGADNVNHKKRELDNDEEQMQEKILDNDDRTGDQTKKIKMSEPADISAVETKESDNNLMVNGTTATEV